MDIQGVRNDLTIWTDILNPNMHLDIQGVCIILRLDIQGVFILRPDIQGALNLEKWISSTGGGVQKVSGKAHSGRDQYFGWQFRFCEEEPPLCQ